MVHSDGVTNAAGGYQPPAVTVIGTVEAITLSARSGSYSDFKGRSDKKA